MTEAKKDYYKRVGADSLKQAVMMKEWYWAEKQIKIQGGLMKEWLITFKANNHSDITFDLLGKVTSCLNSYLATQYYDSY